MPEWCYTEFYSWLDSDNSVEWLYIGLLYWRNEPWKFALNLAILPAALLLSFVVLFIPDSYPMINKAPYSDIGDNGLIWYHLVVFVSQVTLPEFFVFSQILSLGTSNISDIALVFL